MSLKLKKIPLEAVQISVYSDASWANGANKRTIYGFLIFVDQNLIEFKSKQLPLVVLSSTEAEYSAACEAMKKSLWVQNMLIELGVSIEKVHFFVDNQPAICILRSERAIGRTKFLDLRLQFLRQKFQNPTLMLTYVPTERNFADILTKALGQTKFEYLRQYILEELIQNNEVVKVKMIYDSTLLLNLEKLLPDCYFPYGNNKYSERSVRSPLELALRVKSNIDDCKTLTIIDLGAGFGDLCGLFHQAKVIAVEIDPKKVSEGKKLYPKFWWINGDITQPCFYKRFAQKADIVISNPPFERAVEFILIGLIVSKTNECYMILPSNYFYHSKVRNEVLKKLPIQIDEEVVLGKFKYYQQQGIEKKKMMTDSLFKFRIGKQNELSSYVKREHELGLEF